MTNVTLADLQAFCSISDTRLGHDILSTHGLPRSLRTEARVLRAAVIDWSQRPAQTSLGEAIQRAAGITEVDQKLMSSVTDRLAMTLMKHGLADFHPNQKVNNLRPREELHLIIRAHCDGTTVKEVIEKEGMVLSAKPGAFIFDVEEVKDIASVEGILRSADLSPRHDVRENLRAAALRMLDLSLQAEKDRVFAQGLAGTFVMKETIVNAAAAEIIRSETIILYTDEERSAFRDGVRSVMVDVGLYGEMTQRLNEIDPETTEVEPVF